MYTQGSHKEEKYVKQNPYGLWFCIDWDLFIKMVNYDCKKYMAG